MITICSLLSPLPTSKVNGENWIHLTTNMINLETVAKKVIKIGHESLKGPGLATKILVPNVTVSRELPVLKRKWLA